MDNLGLFFSQLHFLRPLWLLLLVPVPFLIGSLRHSKHRGGAWHKVIDAPLLHAMLNPPHQAQSAAKPIWPWWLMAWLLCVIALAGPAYKKMPQPVQQNQQALIILLDMSASMAATDLQPNRATRAIQKVTDILRTRNDGLTALIAYAGDAHTVTPLTHDTQTISTLLPALSPFIMPAAGSRPDKAVKLARSLASNSGLQRADLLLITDGLLEKDAERIKAELRPGLALKILALGTAEGAPIALPNGGFLRDANKQVVIAQLDKHSIRSVSQALNAPWREFSLSDQDWQALLSPTAYFDANQEANKQQFDLWRDDGYWLIFLLLPIALLLFRRGALLCLPLALLLAQPQPAHASPWLTPDQQAAKLSEHNPQQAAELFQHPEWKASAHYQAGNYDQAAQHFAQLPENAENRYNLGNALAQSGQLQQAIDAYTQALSLQPDFPQAEENKALVEALLQQQEQQQQEQSQNQQNSEQQDSADKADAQQEPQSSANHSDQHNNQEEAQDAENRETDEPADAEQEANEASNQGETEESPSGDLAEQLQPEPQLTREEQEAMEKWLQQIPDNPGNLLQRKFLYQYRQHQQDDFEQGDVLW